MNIQTFYERWINRMKTMQPPHLPPRQMGVGIISMQRKTFDWIHYSVIRNPLQKTPFHCYLQLVYLFYTHNIRHLNHYQYFIFNGVIIIQTAQEETLAQNKMLFVEIKEKGNLSFIEDETNKCQIFFQYDHALR